MFPRILISCSVVSQYGGFSSTRWVLFGFLKKAASTAHVLASTRSCGRRDGAHLKIAGTGRCAANWTLCKADAVVQMFVSEDGGRTVQAFMAASEKRPPPSAVGLKESPLAVRPASLLKLLLTSYREPRRVFTNFMPASGNVRGVWECEGMDMYFNMLPPYPPRLDAWNWRTPHSLLPGREDAPIVMT